MFHDVLFILSEKAIQMNEELIARTIKRLLPDARLRFIWKPKQIVDTTEVDVIVSPQVPWIPDAVKKCPRLRWLHLLTAGAERIFETGLHNGPYWISKSSGVNALAVAEYVIGAMLYFAKQFHVFAHQQRAHQWNRMWLNELSGKKAVILGLGQIGMAVAQRSAALGLYISGISRRALPVQWVNEVFPLEDVELAVAGGHFVIVALPLTSSTRGLINHKFFSHLAQGTILIDVSRGGIVVEAALIDALRSGHLGGVALDVFEEEPLPSDSELWDFPNLLITPHVAGTSDRFMERAMEIFEENLCSLNNRGIPATPVDRAAGY
jgi:phosphoglycerate dehydrogenase-like enzyme